MLNEHLIYKPPSSCGIMFHYGGYPRYFSHMGKLRALVVPVRGFRKVVIIQGVLEPTGVLTNEHS